MKRSWSVVGMLLLTVAGAPLRAAQQTQVLDEFGSPAADGRPMGWEALGFGAEATITHDANAPGSMKVSYRFTDRNGVIYLLSRCRLRCAPFNFEFTAKGDKGNEVVGLLLREAVSGKVRELPATPLNETGWATRTIDLKLPAGEKLETLAGGGGLRVDGLTVRKGPGTPDQGTLLFSELLMNADVTPAQAAMIDLVCGRWDGLFMGDEEPRVEALVCSLSTDRASLDVSYTVTDSEGRSVGQGSPKAPVQPGQAARIPIKFTPRGKYGFFKVTASVKQGASQRYATARFGVVPTVPDGDGRNAHIEVTPHRMQREPWFDVMLLRTLKRAGAASAQIPLNWNELEPTRGRRNWADLDYWVGLSKQAGLPLSLVAWDPPRWLRDQGTEQLVTAFKAFCSDAKRRAGDQVVAWEVWRRPDNSRFWPPEPQPMGFRQLLQDTGELLRGGRATVVSGGLDKFDRGYVASLLTGGLPADSLGFAAPEARKAFPFLNKADTPSADVFEAVVGYEKWLAETGRTPVPVSVVGGGVRTSPLEESKLGQAVELARCAALARGHGGQFSWQTAIDGDDERDRYGLIRRDLTPKAGLVALAAYAAMTHGGKALGRSKSDPPLYVLQAPSGFLGVGLGQAGSARFSVSGEVKVFDFWGNPLSSNSASTTGPPLYFSGAGLARMVGG